MKKLKMKIISIIMSIALAVSLLPYGNTGSTEMNLSPVNEFVQTLSEDYSISTEEIEDEIEKGYSLYDIQAALSLQESTGDSYQTILMSRNPRAINKSDKVTSQFVSNTSGINTSSVSIRYPGSKTKSIDPSSLLTALKAKPNEAPYQVNSNIESISTISGGLTYLESDAYLPGRNGHSFTLTRTYNSQNSQEYEMDVDTSSSLNYYVHIPFEITQQEKIYAATTLMQAYEEYDFNCNNENEASYDDRIYLGGSNDKPNVSEETFSSKAAAEEHVFHSEIKPWSQITCIDPNPGGEDEMKIGAPTNLMVTDTTFNSITLNWDYVQKATKYILYLNHAEIGSSYSTSFTFKNLTENKEYTLGVKAVDENNQTESTITPINAKTNTSSGITLSKPTITNSSATENAIYISWGKVDNALGYKLYLDNDENPKAYVTGYSYTFSGLLSNKPYNVKVSAVHNEIESGKAEKTIWTKPACTKNCDPFNFYTASDVKKKTRTSYYPSTVDAILIDIKEYSPISIPEEFEEYLITDYGPYTEQEANEMLEYLESKFAGLDSNGVIKETPWDSENGKETRLVATLEGQPEIIGPIEEDIYYYNKTTTSKKSPIGIGWSWNIPYLETKEINGVSKHFVSLGDGTVYEVDGKKFKGDLWNQYSFSVNSVSPSQHPTDSVSKYIVSSIDGKNYYFNEKGHLLFISDTYGNLIKFFYQTISPYGTVIKTIEDSLKNQITIDFIRDETNNSYNVKITSGKDDVTKIVTYNKKLYSNHEELEYVEDPSGKTTYHYSEHQALFNLLGNNPLQSNPYILLDGVTHPTGANTVYKYESTPVTFSTGPNSINQYYKISSRYDEVFFEDKSSKKYNLETYRYENDLGTQADYIFTTIKQGLTETTYTIKKDYIDDKTPPAYYILEEKAKGTNITKEIGYLYDEINRNPLPITIKTQNRDNLTGALSDEVTISKKYLYGKVISEETPLQKITTDYNVRESTLASIPGHIEESSQFKLLVPVKENLTNYQSEKGRDQIVQTVYEYLPKGSGNITERIVTVKNGNQYLNKEHSHFDQFGNIIKNSTYQDSPVNPNPRKLEVNLEYESTHHAFVQKVEMKVKDANGELSTISKHFEYDSSNGKIAKYVDGDKYKTEFQYDLLDRVTKIIFDNPDSTNDPTIEHVYDDEKNVIITTNEEGEKTKQEWNPLGWKIGEYLYQGNQFLSKLQLGYDDYGRIYTSTDASGSLTVTESDEWNRPLITYNATDISGSGEKVKYLYNDIQNKVQITDANENVVEETSDKYGRTIEKKKWTSTQDSSSIQPFETFQYTGDDYQVIDAKGYPTIYEQDTLGRLTSVTYPASLPNIPRDQTYSYLYDLNGNLTRTIYPDGRILTKQYDELGRLVSETDPEGKVSKYFYDGRNNLTKRIDKDGKEYEDQYNYRNFLTSKEVINSPNQPEKVTYQHDLTGRVTNTIEHLGSTTKTTNYQYYQKDDQDTGAYVGLLKTKVLPDGSTLTNLYDKNGNRNQLDLEIAGQSWSIYYGYDVMNRMSSVQSSQIAKGPTENFTIKEEYSYQSNGLLQNTNRPKYTSKNFTYKGLLLDSVTDQKKDSADNLTSQLISTYQYGYDDNENVTSLQDHANLLQTFSYDELDRILTSSQHQETYGYDVRGNRQTLQSNQLPTMQIAQYEYDHWNQLSKVTTEDGSVVEYQYNHDGLLEERTEDNVTTRYYFDGEDIIAEGTVQENGQAELKQRYIRGANGLIAKVSEDENEKLSYGGIAYYHTNGQGDVVSLRDPDGNVLKSYLYDIWGNIEKEETTVDVNISNPFLYSGEYWDSSTNLQYLRARWYDPSLGRFLTEDTVKGDTKNPLSLNLYTYVENNPLKYQDPSGNVPVAILIPVAVWVGKHLAQTATGMGMDLAIAKATGKPYNVMASFTDNVKDISGAGKVKKAGKVVEAVKGTNAKGQVTSRGGFRKETIQNAWKNAEDGPTGGKLCPTCKVEVKVKPFSGQKRDWDIDHTPSWTNRLFTFPTRKAVLDDYQKGTRLECPSCNRSRGNKD
jgi:RHS repeat-associated protein